MSTSTSASSLNRRLLNRLCEVRFYEEKCNIHPHFDKTRFCMSCMDGPLCQLCVNDFHNCHQVLQVYKRAARVVVQVSDMKHLGVDIDYIQNYRNLFQEVVHLHEKTNKRPKPDLPRCERCEAGLKISGKKFCSITCKFNLLHGDDGEAVLRRHSRKGIPIRSPLQ